MKLRIIIKVDTMMRKLLKKILETCFAIIIFYFALHSCGSVTLTALQSSYLEKDKSFDIIICYTVNPCFSNFFTYVNIGFKSKIFIG